MSDIDFLADNKARDQKDKNQNDKKEKIVWSEPDNKSVPKETAFSALPFFSKKKAASETAAKPAIDKSSTILGKGLDKNKIKKSREEILKLIKRESLAQEVGVDKHALGGQSEDLKSSTGNNFFKSLKERLSRPANPKEILIDYRSALNQDSKKNSAVTQANRPDNKIISAKNQASSPRLNEKKPVIAKTKPGSSWLNNFFSLFKSTKPTLKLESPTLPRVNRPKEPAQVKIVPEQPIRKPETMPKISKPEKKETNKTAALKQTEPARFKATKVIETNLIKGEIITFFDWHSKIISLIKAILMPVFLIGIIYLGLTIYQRYSQAEIQDQAQKFDLLSEKIKQAELGLKEITDFQTRQKLVSKIFSQHIYWTNFFKFLEANTIKDVYYGGFAGDTSGVYPLSAVATRFSNISEQVNQFKNSQKVIDAQAAGGEFMPASADNKSGVRFNLDLTVSKSIFTE